MITKFIFEQACIDYNCRDNLSLVIVDLNKHLLKVREEKNSPKNNLMAKRHHSVAEFSNNNNVSPIMQNPFMVPMAYGTPNAGYPAFMP